MRVGRELAQCPHLPHQRAVGSCRTPLRGRRDTRCVRCTAGLELRAPALPLERPPATGTSCCNSLSYVKARSVVLAPARTWMS
jgi:hypothetical protein